MLNKSFFKFFFGFLFILAVSFGIIIYTGSVQDGAKATVDSNDIVTEEVE